MPTKPHEHEFSLPARLLRLAISVEDINGRIARLTQNLHLNLSQESELHRVFQLEGVDNNPYRQHRLEELRGLLVLRYDLVRHHCASLGFAATRTLIEYAAQQLESSGFNPLLSGADVQHLCAET